MSDVQKFTADELVELYAKAAAAHGTAIERSDSGTANHSADAIVASYRELKLRGQDAQRKILQLLSNEDPAVRGMAAAAALEFAPETAERALMDIVGTDMGMVAFAAGVVLEQWRNGRSRFC